MFVRIDLHCKVLADGESVCCPWCVVFFVKAVLFLSKQDSFWRHSPYHKVQQTGQQGGGYCSPSKVSVKEQIHCAAKV